MHRLGQRLKGRLGHYLISKQIQETVWFAKDQHNKMVVIKSVQNHPRVQNEKQLLKRFAGSPYIRQLVDEVPDIPSPGFPTIVLKHLDDHLLNATVQRTLNRNELKFVSKCVLEGLATLHGEGYIHTDIKLDNVLVNYTSDSNNRFADVMLGDLGGTCHVESDIAKTGTQVGAPMWSSPEVLMESPWGTSTDIWSFGAMLIALVYGGDFNLFRQRVVPFGHEEYDLEILKQQFRYFGPFPDDIGEAINDATAEIILYLMREISYSEVGLFSRISEKEICREDKAFISKIMKMDWRARPTAKELLQDDWFLDH